MSPRPALAALLLLLPPACAPRAVVRPGGAGSPTAFRVRSPAAAVALSGAMTGWRPVPLVRRGGAFEIELALPAGRYEYRLEESTGVGAPQVLFPAGVERTPDGFGGENAVLRVR